MPEFLAGQLDYIFFIYGLSLILLAIISFGLHKKDQHSRPWNFLAVFGLTHGINEWLDMLALSMDKSQALDTVRLIVLALSFFILFEFGRRGWTRFGRPILGKHILVLFCVLAGLGASTATLDGINVSCRYALAFPGAALAALVLWNTFFDEKESQRILLKAAAAAMFIYGLSTGLVVPKADFFPASALSYDSFLSFCGFPVQLVRTVCLILCTFFLFHYYLDTYFSQGLKVYRRQGLAMFYGLALVMTAVILLGWSQTYKIGNTQEQLRKKEILLMASEVAFNLDLDSLRAVKESPANEQSQDYIELHQRQTEEIIKLKDHNVHWIYLMVMENGKIIFTADSILKDDPQYSPPGDVYTDPPQELLEVFKGKKWMVSNPYTDRWGTFVSAFVPILDPHTFEVIAVLGMDIDNSIWKRFVFRQRLVGIIFMFFLSAMIFSFLFYQYRIFEIQKELAESRDQLRLALKSSAMGMWHWNVLENMHSWDEQTHVLHGADPKTFSGRNEDFLKMVDSKDQKKVLDAFAEAIRTGIYAVDYRVVWPDGNVRDLSQRGKVFYDDKGDALRLNGTCWDITDRKKAESQMRALSRAVEQSPSSIMITNRDGTIEYVNPRFEQATGYSRAEIVGHNPRFLKSEKTPPETYQQMWKAILEGGEWRGEMCNRRKNGELFWEYSAMSGLIDESGQISHYIAVKEDITVRKKVEEALQENERLLRNIIDAIPGGVFWKDKNSVYLGCNIIFAKVAGFNRPEDVVGKTDYDMAWAGQEAEHYKQDDREVIESCRARLNVETQLHHPGGAKSYLIKSTVPLRNQFDEVVGVLGIFVDITKIKMLELELVLARDKAQQASLAKDQFLANMSHEIRTPMNSILGFSRLLKKFAMEEKAQHYLDVILINCDHLLDIINDILDMSKIDSGGIVLEKIDFNLRELIDDVISLVKYKVHEKNCVELGYHVADNLPQVLVGDPMRLKQVVLNLLGNALKFTSQGSVFLNVVLEKTVENTDADVALRFSVKDTGIGIPQDKIETVFEKFTQVDSSTTRKYGGTGLGLAICRQLVSLMEGKIWAVSELGKGSEFIFVVKFKKTTNEI